MRRFFVFLLLVLAVAAAAWWFGKAPLAAVQGIGVLTLVIGILAGTSYLPRGGQRFLGLVYAFALFAGLIGGIGWFQFSFKPAMVKGFIATMQPPTQTVAVAEAKSESWAPSITAIGTLRAVAGGDIAPQVGGVIKAMNFDRGQDVEKGSLLVQLDDAVEQADLRSNMATLKNADINLDRQKGLIGGGNTARSTLDQAQAARDTAAAAVDRTKALIDQKALKAPFAGRVGLRKGDIGQYVAPGFSIANLQQLDPIYVDFSVPEQSIAAVKVGAAVQLTVDAYAGKVFSGKVRAIDARVDAATRNVTIRAEVPNPDKTLLPGMFASVSASAGAARDVVTIPRTGVSFSLYGDTVFVAKPADGEDPAIRVLDRRLARVGDTREDRVAIIEGVAAGETIVVEGQLKLQQGMKVRVDNASALPAAPSPRPKE